MSSLYANTLNEMEKLWVQKRTKFMLTLAVLIPTMASLMIGKLQSTLGITVQSGSDFPLLMLNAFTSLILPIFIFLLAAELFSGEAEVGTMKNILVRPISRANVFASKVLAIAIYTMICLGLIWLISVPAGFFMDRSQGVSGFFNSVLAYPTSLVPMLAVGFLAVMVSQWLNSGIGALALCIFIFITAKLLPFIFPQVAMWSIFSYTDWHIQWSNQVLSVASQSNHFLILVSSCIINYTAGLFLFEKKQF
jgi:ABC-2 type transport system permease protein